MIWFLDHILGAAAGTANFLWGGFLSCLSEFTIIGALGQLYWSHTCHEPRCWRPGHLMGDGHTRSCWSHHPDGKPKPGHVRRAHALHKARTGGAP